MSLADPGDGIPTIASYATRSVPGNRTTGGRRKQTGSTINDRPTVSVITVCLNAQATLDRTIESVASQTFRDFEYLIVDGGSTDGTRGVLERRGDLIDGWISESDRGISDAFNKGIAGSRGRYVVLLNSDDWLPPTHLQTAVDALEGSGAAFVFGDLALHTTPAQPDWIMLGDADYGRCLHHAMPDLNHPTLVCRRSVYEQVGLFDLRLRFAMDYEWFLRGYRAGIRGRYVPGLTTHMSRQGISHRAFIRGLREVRDVSVRYGYPAAFARMRFAFRVAKTSLRIGLADWLPDGLHDRLRRLANKSYRSAGPRGLQETRQ